MQERSRMKCFFILPILMLLCFILFLTGCGQAEIPNALMEQNGAEERTPKETLLTLEGLEEQLNTDSVREGLKDLESFEQEGHDTYGYDSLTEAQKLWYEDINLLLSTRFEEKLQLSAEGIRAGLSEDDLDIIYQCVLMDHPEYFYVIGYEYTKYTSKGTLVGLEISGTYSLPLEECLNRKAEMERVVNSLLEQAPREGTDYEKIKYVYETIIYQTEYDLEAPDNQNIYSVFVGKASVCQGYAKATQYLLNRLGVKCTLVQGTVEAGEGHSWNMVKSSEEYYFVDTTWGDASYTLDGVGLEKEGALEINYDYLCTTTEQLFKTHTPDAGIVLPICDATEDNYYIREGCYFYGYDEEQLQREFAEADLHGVTGLTIKCDSQVVYRELHGELVESQRVFEYLEEGQKTISFIEDEEQLSMTFWVTK